MYSFCFQLISQLLCEEQKNVTKRLIITIKRRKNFKILKLTRYTLAVHIFQQNIATKTLSQISKPIHEIFIMKKISQTFRLYRKNFLQKKRLVLTSVKILASRENRRESIKTTWYRIQLSQQHNTRNSPPLLRSPDVTCTRKQTTTGIIKPFHNAVHSNKHEFEPIINGS